MYVKKRVDMPADHALWSPVVAERGVNISITLIA